MNRRGIVMLALVCTSCGGRIDHAAGAEDTGSPVDAGTAPQEIAVGDAGLICSVPVVTLGDSGQCAIAMTCTGGLTVDGRELGAGAIVSCSVNGNETNSFTEVGASPGGYCANPAAFAALAAQCIP